MAVAYESISISTWQTVTNGNPLTITKPTGLAVGDIMVAHLSNVVGGANNADGWDTPSGWTSLISQNQDANANSSARMNVFYKIADSTDAAASDFSFVKNGSSGTTVQGSIYRISGGAFVTGAVAVATDTTTPSFTNTITPDANSVLLFLTTVADAAQTTGSVASQAITTSNPTWTEVTDSVGNIGAHRGLVAGAYATRPEATATGNSTCAYTSYQQNSIGAIIAISPITSVTVSPAVVTVTATVQAPSVSAGASVTVTVVTVVASIQAPTVNISTSTWADQNKSSNPTWTDQPKS